MVPEGYFDNFSKELMNKLPEKEQTSCSARNNNYLATYQALDIYGSYVLWIDVQRQSCCRSPKQDTPIFTAAETEQFSDEYIETILDHSMMDDYTLYQYLTDANSDMYN